MSIAISNRINDLEIAVQQLKDMQAIIYKQLDEITKLINSQQKVNKRG